MEVNLEPIEVNLEPITVKLEPIEVTLEKLPDEFYKIDIDKLDLKFFDNLEVQ